MSERPPEEPTAGRRRFREVYGSGAQPMIERLEGHDPALVEWADEFVFGRVWNRPQLDHEERYLLAITALTCLGRGQQLRGYISGALEAGVDVAKIREAMMMMTVYAGFASATSALDILKEVLDGGPAS